MEYLALKPASRFNGECTGDLKDPQRHIDIQLTDEEITEAVKKMLDEPISECSKTGLRPFYASNKPPAVRIASFYFNPPSFDTF